MIFEIFFRGEHSLGIHESTHNQFKHKNWLSDNPRKWPWSLRAITDLNERTYWSSGKQARLYIPGLHEHPEVGESSLAELARTTSKIF